MLNVTVDTMLPNLVLRVNSNPLIDGSFETVMIALITIVADIFHTCTGLVDALQIKVKVSPGHT